MKLKDILKVIDSQQHFVINSDDGFVFDKNGFSTDTIESHHEYYVLNIWYSDIYKGLFIDISKSPKE